MDVRYITINEEDLDDLPIVDGQIIALADTPRWYYDMNDTRYDASTTMYCSALPAEDDALNGVIYILNRDPDSSGDDPEHRLNGMYLFLGGEYIKISQIYNPASANELGLVKVGTNIEVTEGGVISIPSSKIKAIAGIATTASTGLVKIGGGLDVTDSGQISVNTDQITQDIMEEIRSDPSVFPTASKDSVGVVRIGDNIDVENGVIHVTSQNVIDALGYVPGEGSGTTVSAGSTTHPVYVTEGEPTPTGYYLDIWATGNGKAASYATSEGNMTTASGQCSHAEGYKTLASGVYSHAEGNQSTASNTGAHAQGYLSRATGDYSFASGYMSTASGSNAIAQGYRSDATGNNAIAFGAYAHATGSTAVCIGVDSKSSGSGTIVLGNSSTAAYPNEVSIGSYGTPTDNLLHNIYYSDYVSESTKTASTHTIVYGDYYADYNAMTKGPQYPYPLTGVINNIGGAVRTRLGVDSLSDLKHKIRYMSSYTYPYASTSPYQNGVQFPLKVNSGLLGSPWTPIMTRLVTDSNNRITQASTLISGLISTDNQPVVYCKSYEPTDQYVISLPDSDGSLVLCRSGYRYSKGDKVVSTTTRYRLYYAVPSDWMTATATQYGCNPVLLGDGKGPGTSTVSYIGLNWCNSTVSDSSTSRHYAHGQFLFYCSKPENSTTDYWADVAVYSLPMSPASFSSMQINKK